jgi:hypothetical protein
MAKAADKFTSFGRKRRAAPQQKSKGPAIPDAELISLCELRKRIADRLGEQLAWLTIREKWANRPTLGFQALFATLVAVFSASNQRDREGGSPTAARSRSGRLIIGRTDL